MNNKTFHTEIKGFLGTVAATSFTVKFVAFAKSLDLPNFTPNLTALKIYIPKPCSTIYMVRLWLRLFLNLKVSWFYSEMLFKCCFST